MLKEIQQQFFAYRNGILADQLRSAGCPCSVIFGLNVPQLAAIARQYESSTELADALWGKKNDREARLLACYLFPKSEVDADKARALIADVQTPEEADMLCFRLLKHLPFASELAAETATSDNQLTAYLSRSLSRHLE